MGASASSENGSPLKSPFGKNLLALLAALAAALGVYYSTVSALQISLASKADLSQMAGLEKRINLVENTIEKSFISRDDFFEFREEMNYRLLKIEFKLENIMKGNINGQKR